MNPFVLGAILCAAPLAAQAYSVGIFNRSQTGCGGARCHAGGQPPSVELRVPAQVIGGETVDVWVAVTTEAAQIGLNLAAPGALAGDGLRASVVGETPLAEVAHGEALAVRDGVAEVLVRWTAPEAGGDVALYVAANAVDGDGSAAGDAWGLATASVAVSAAPVMVDAAAPADASVDASVDGAVDASIAPRGGGEGGCSAAPGLGPWFAVLALVGLRRRR